MSELKPPEPDGLIAPKVKSSYAHKHHFLARYIRIFTQGMKYKPWELHYVDLFAGAGVNIVENHGLQWGSPLLAAQSEHRFFRLHLCEKTAEKFQALEKRLEQFVQPNAPQCLNEEASSAVQRVAAAIPADGTLTLAFLDPYGLHLRFESLAHLVEGRRMDLIIFFPDRLDALRNWGVYLDASDSNLDRFLGTNEWVSIGDRFPSDKWGDELLKLYQRQLQSLGYRYFDGVSIQRTGGAPLYKLVFCSRHERGGEFWRKIARTDNFGQSDLF